MTRLRVRAFGLAHYIGSMVVVGAAAWNHGGICEAIGAVILAPLAVPVIAFDLVLYRDGRPQVIIAVVAYLIIFAMAYRFFTRAAIFRRERMLQGKCPTCGYDLTGNTSGVCPECGTPVMQGAP